MSSTCRRAPVHVAIAALCAGLVLVAAAGAASPERSRPRLPSFATTHVGGSKLDTALARVARLPGVGAALASARAHGIDVAGSKVRVIVEPGPGRAGEARSLLGAVGGSVVGEAGGLIEALVWPGSLRRVAGDGAVAEVRTPARPFALGEETFGSAAAAVPVGEGIATTNANVWQAAGLDGTGVKVAVVDLGFYGYADLLGTALPATVTPIDHCDGNLAAPPAAGGTDHGTGVAEIVHQMAPGAELYLICADTEVGLVEAEEDAAAAGVRIVNHSVGWYITSRGDGSGKPGTPDGVVAAARAHGILWVNASGDSTQHWSGTYVADADDPTVNDFAPGDALNTVRVRKGDEVCAYLKWDNWPTTTEDFDLRLIDEPADTVVDESETDQSGSADEPTEALCYTNTGATRNFGVAIVDYSTSDPGSLDLTIIGPSPEYQVAAGSVVEPASSPRALAVGANCWRRGHYGNAAEFFSAHGPTIDGRVKPDLLAPDGVSTATFGTSTGSSCANGFTGTSAASPHVAGAAALLLQRTPTLTPAGLEGALVETALSHRFTDAADNNVGAGNLWLGGLTPTGTIAFSTAPAGHPSEIWSMSEDGTGVRLRATPALAAGGFVAPSWSPDGSKLAFTATSGASPFGVFTVGSDPYAPDTALETVDSSQFNAAWLADASKLSFDNGASITLVSPSTHVATTFGAGEAASWSPDGTRVAYLSPGGGTGHLFVANADGSGPHELTTGVAAYMPRAPAWSPDSTTLAFVSAAAQTWLVDANGTNPRFLVAGTSPQWSAGGDRVLFLAGGGSSVRSIRADGTGPAVVLAEFPSTGAIAWRSQPPTGAPVVWTPPVVTGDRRVGALVHVDTGRWLASAPVSLSYSWQRCNLAGGGCVPIPGAHDNGYRLAASDAGGTVRAAVTLTDPNGTQSAASAAVSVDGVVGLPGPPSGVAAAAGDGRATVAFSPPAAAGSSAIVAYTAIASSGDVVATGASSPISVTGLTNGTSYTFTVTATNLTGEGLPSPASNAVTPVGPPGAPTSATATAGDGQATVVFAPPANNGGEAVTHYTATAAPGGQSGNSAGGPITVGGLANGVGYTFTVTATSGLGTGLPSPPTGSVTPAGPERPHPQPPAEEPRPDVPSFVAPNRRPPLP